MEDEICLFFFFPPHVTQSNRGWFGAEPWFEQACPITSSILTEMNSKICFFGPKCQNLLLWQEEMGSTCIRHEKLSTCNKSLIWEWSPDTWIWEESWTCNKSSSSFFGRVWTKRLKTWHSFVKSSNKGKLTRFIKKKKGKNNRARLKLTTYWVSDLSIHYADGSFHQARLSMDLKTNVNLKKLN